MAPRMLPPRLMSTAVFVVMASIAAITVVQSESARRQHERALVASHVGDYARQLETYITRALSASYALAALVEVARGDIPDFDKVAAQLLPLYPGASELLLAPNGVIQQVAPLSGNEKALGLDLLKFPSQRTEATITRASGQLTLAGPFELVQGGQALAGRLPVFLEDAGGGARFWGFTEVVMRLPDALQPAHLSQLSAEGYHYELWRKHPQTGTKQIIQASTGSSLVDPIETSVRVPNGTWTLSVEPDRGWGDALGVTLKSAVGLIVALLCAYLAHLLLAQRARGSELELLVSRRTADIKTAKDQLKALLDAIPDPVWLKDANGVFLSCNPQVERYFNAAESDIVGRTDYDLLDPLLADSFRENDRKAMEADGPRANEEWLTFARDGYRGLFETIKAPMRGPDGKIMGVLGIARDITARYRAEKAAKLMKTRLSIALQATQIAIWDWDIRHDRWYASREYYTVLGYAPESKLGDRQIWLERVHPDDRARVRAAIEAALSGAPHLYEYEARLRSSDGVYRWMSVRGKTVQRDREGRAVRMLGVRMDITDRKHAEERIRRLAHYDTLTGLPNRTLLNERMSKNIALAESERQSLAVLVLDIDKFKNVNDTFGQTIGDALLVEIGKRIHSLAREDDTVARVSGDTFVMVLLGAKTTQATRMAQRLLDILSAPFRIRELELVVTPTIGVAMFPAHGTDFDALIKSADTAMHRAKHAGRNQYVFFTEEMQARAVRNQVLESALRHAIERNELQLHYQPLISLSDNRITGAEALLRWHNPDLGHVAPAEFIPIIEDSGQIVQIGTWVLRTAATQLRDWLTTGVTAFSLAVNISSAQFRHPNLPGLIGKILHETGLEPRSLELELTEGVAMDDPLAAIAIMNELHDLGVRISIDDFGTGYSSLSYLKRFRVHKLKIDQSFVRDVADDADDQAIVKAIINLANSLGIDTIAEGVETLPQLTFLQTHGCQEAQGFYFSKPVPVDQFTALLKAVPSRGAPGDWSG
jgi:diguanylate cyclase (GGDEF)-like protein/PAS domain S-box-containing protein